MDAAQSVELTWNLSTTPSVVGYKVYFGTESHVYPNSAIFGMVSDVIIPGLSAGTTYYFGVTAVDTNGSESAFSNEAVYTVPNPGSIDLQVQASTEALQAVDVSWTPSTDSGVYGYAINYWTQGSGYTNVATFYGTTSGIISGLAAGTNYLFAVSVIDTYGIEAPSSSVIPYTVPNPVPLALSAKTPANTAGVELMWNALPNAGIIGYYIYYGTASGNYSSSQYCGDVNDFVVHGLNAGQTYYFVIVPMDAYGNLGQYSQEVSWVASAPVPIGIQAQATTAAMEAVDISWTASLDSDVSGYAVYYGPQSGNYQNSMYFFGVGDGVVSGLTPGTYYFAVAPIDAFGVEAIASTSVSYTIQAPPALVLHAKALTNSPGVELTWNGIPNEGITSYNVYYGTASGSYSYSQGFDASQNDVIINGLNGGQTYYFTVNGVDQYGNQSPYSNEVSASTVKPKPMMLQTQVYLDGYGQPYAMLIGTPSTVYGNWEVDFSTDLQNWTPYSYGYGSGNGDGFDVDVWVPIDPTQPPMYFRAINY